MDEIYYEVQCTIRAATSKIHQSNNEITYWRNMIEKKEVTEEVALPLIINAKMEIEKQEKIYWSSLGFFDLEIETACKKNNKLRLRSLLRHGIDIDQIFIKACYTKNLKLIKHYKEYITNFDLGLQAVCQNQTDKLDNSLKSFKKQKKIILYLLQFPVTKFGIGLGITAAQYDGHPRLTRYLLGFGKQYFGKEATVSLGGAIDPNYDRQGYGHKRKVLDYLVEIGNKNKIRDDVKILQVKLSHKVGIKVINSELETYIKYPKS